MPLQAPWLKHLQVLPPLPLPPRARLHEQSCQPPWPALFLVCTAGIAEGGLTPEANGVIRMAEEVVVDLLEFLRVVAASPEGTAQRPGRTGRDRDGLARRLQPSKPGGDATWPMPS